MFRNLLYTPNTLVDRTNCLLICRHVESRERNNKRADVNGRGVCSLAVSAALYATGENDVCPVATLPPPRTRGKKRTKTGHQAAIAAT